MSSDGQSFRLGSRPPEASRKPNPTGTPAPPSHRPAPAPEMSRKTRSVMHRVRALSGTAIRGRRTPVLIPGFPPSAAQRRGFLTAPQA